MKKIGLTTIYTLITGGLLAVDFIAQFPISWQIIFAVALGLSYVYLLLSLFKYQKLHRSAIAVLIVIICAMALYAILFYSGLLVHFSSIASTRQWFASFGAWAWLVYFAIQYLQVLLIPLPAQITTVAGALIFGGWIAFLISTVAVVLGSFTAFAIGKSAGVGVAIKISSKETVEKYQDLLTKKGLLFLPIMFLFPLFPDDLLCFIAGTTKMSWAYFVAVTLLTRPLGIGLICFFGSGDIIPFSGWGIPVWIVLFAVLVSIALVLLKYQDKIINWVINTFGKKTKFDRLKDGKMSTESKQLETARGMSANENCNKKACTQKEEVKTCQKNQPKNSKKIEK